MKLRANTRSQGLQLEEAGPCQGGMLQVDFYLRDMGMMGLATEAEGYGHDRLGICLGDGQMETYLKDMDMTGLASA